MRALQRRETARTRDAHNLLLLLGGAGIAFGPCSRLLSKLASW